VQDQGAQQAAKQGPSSFDRTLKSQGAEHAKAAHAVAQVQQTQQVQQARQIEQVQKTDGARLNKAALNPSGAENKSATGRMDPVTQKSEVQKGNGLIGSMLEGMEKGQASLDKLISGGMTGKNFSNSELIALQAGMYKYTQELELTGKVVEKATSGLKDTLKTQV
jgi:hypothetical protein